MLSVIPTGLARRAPGLIAALMGVAVLGPPPPALAQMVLPGAVAPSAVGSPEAPPAGRPKPKPGAVRIGPVQPISPAVLAGKTLALNGGASQITFEAHDKSIEVARLTLTGELISNNQAMCRIDAPNTPIRVVDAGHPDGVARVQLDFPACPIGFDVLDGAVLVDTAQPVCEFKEANCRVNPAGLWGPQPSDLGADKVKGIDHIRAASEASVRANYKALAATTKDRPTIMGFAREQAQFSSTREEICRDYAGEGRHGFCAAKLTEARAAMLRAKLGDAAQAKAEKKARKRPGRAGGKP